MKQRLAPRMPLAQLNTFTSEEQTPPADIKDNSIADNQEKVASAHGITPVQIGSGTATSASQVAIEISVKLVDPSPYQPRINFAPDAIDALAASIETDGLWVPISVRKLPTGRYELIGGERRLRAHEILGKETILAYVVDRMSEFDAAVAAVGENEARTDLCDYERGKAFRRLLDMPPNPGEARLTQVSLAKRIAKSEATISRCLSYFSLPEEALLLLDRQPDLIGAKNAMALAGLVKKGYSNLVVQALRRIKEEGASEQGAVNWAISEVNKATQTRPEAQPWHINGRHVADMSADGMKLVITCKNGLTPVELMKRLQQANLLDESEQV